MSNESRSMKRQLDKAELFLKNIQQEDLLYSLKAHGYEEPSLEKGEVLYAKVLQLMEEKRNLKIAYSDAKSQFLKASKEARKFFIDALVSARRYSREEWIHQELKLKGRAPRNFLGWTEKAEDLYKALINNKKMLDNYKNSMLVKDNLEHGLQMLENLKPLHAAAENTKGKSQQATINQKKAFHELRKWYRKVTGICRMAFSEDPKQLVRLGIKPLFPPRVS